MTKHLFWYGCECCGNETFKIKNQIVTLKFTTNNEIYCGSKKICNEDKHKYTCERCREPIN